MLTFLDHVTVTVLKPYFLLLNLLGLTCFLSAKLALRVGILRLSPHLLQFPFHLGYIERLKWLSDPPFLVQLDPPLLKLLDGGLMRFFIVNQIFKHILEIRHRFPGIITTVIETFPLDHVMSLSSLYSEVKDTLAFVGTVWIGGGVWLRLSSQ